ncbi:MAG: excinuclease ABC subunit C [Legionellales bacterium]|nr:excinuclease ABC subunit C [Legionellales bacterium]|tara:strand:- start:1130 stop:2986 length:1857 start_codon:yes stop_codon:yes gene_type:complete
MKTSSNETDENHSFDAKAFIKTLPKAPGVYRMLNQDGDVLYVGKAKSLRNRVASYFQKNHPSPKTTILVSQIADIAITVTNTENEALILEQNLIKQFKPRYNVLLRDDKSYPYIYISSKDEYPRMVMHRGAKGRKGDYYGPYPSVVAARASLSLLQKLFRIRSCSDSFFANRSRPCLQYQIKRCTAPCVGYITPQDYAEDLRHAELFLAGKNQAIIELLLKRMDEASHQKNYEQAAQIRDQIQQLRVVQEQQYVSSDKGDVDVIAVIIEQAVACVSMLYIRKGRLLGSKAFYPKLPGALAPEELLNEFIPQYYLRHTQDKDFPREVVTSHDFADKAWISEVLSHETNRQVIFRQQVRTERAKWLKMARSNGEQALASFLADSQQLRARFDALQTALNLPAMPERIECFDISHTMGEATVASCVVFTLEGPLKSDYRRFNIKDITPGDDYAAMKQALTRRYSKLKMDEASLPDLLIIDGGKGQLKQAEAVLEDLQVAGVQLVGIAKGPGRKAGLETLYLESSGEGIHLDETNVGFHLLQQVRDEAHRFAITGHRQQRGKKRQQSVLEDIPGIGAKRRRELLRCFGGLQGLMNASIDEIAKTPGFSRALAERVYEALHDD